MAASNAQVVETLDLRNMAAPDSGRAIYAQRMRVPAGSEWEAVLRFEQDMAVAFAMPNWRVVAAEANGTIPIVAIEQPFTVNDPLYTEEQWYLQQIQASRGWAAALALDGVGQTRIRVAVIDSGIDLDHPEFADLPVELTSYITDGFGDDVLIDDYGHGTHVAGVIAASINNGTGIAGLAPWVELDARKVLDGFGNGTISGVASAIMDAADDGAHIINMSLETFIQNPILEEAIKYSSAKGALLIAAGGNCGSPCPPPVRWPAAYPEVMAVAATNFDDTIAGYSAMGPEIEISAPGGESALGTDRIQIYSTWGTDAATRCASTTGNYQRIDGGSYCNSAGTSMAAGVVSGLAALIWGIDPDLTSEDVRAILNLTADDLNVASTRMGSGRINAAAAVRRTIDPAIEVEQDALIEWLDLGVAPFTTTLSLSNPSSRPATWEAALPNADWLHFADTESRTISGTVAYGAPVHLSLTISATDLLTGAVSGMIQIENLDTKESAGAVLVEVLTAIRLDAGPVLRGRSRRLPIRPRTLQCRNAGREWPHQGQYDRQQQHQSGSPLCLPAQR